ncbi:MAG: DNA translocase FtsK [Phycisphaeraceae bacterium]|nr:DNA translocase FtsK [Phycisphaerales bacterium]MCB9841706.1 DNA translocase FtsK [Phycisphaeraceae bacterium]
MPTANKPSRAPKKSAPVQDNSHEPSAILRLAWLAAIFVWAILLAAMLSYSPADAPGHAAAPIRTGTSVSNWIGPVGAAASYHIFLMVGSGAWVIVLAVGAQLFVGLRDGRVAQPALRAAGIVMLALSLSAFHALLLPTWSSSPQGAGGLIAIVAVHELVVRFGSLGAGMWLALFAVVGATVAFDRWLIVAPVMIAHALGKAAHGITHLGGVLARVKPSRANDIDDDPRLRAVAALAGAAARNGIKSRKNRKKAERLNEDAGEIGGTATFDPDEELEDEYEEDEYEEDEYEDDEDEDEDDAEYEDEYDDEDGYEEEDDDLPGAPQVFDADQLREKIAKLPVHFAGAVKKSATQEDLEQLRALRKSEEEADRGYTFPGLDLLEEPEVNFSQEMESYVREQAEALEQSLQTYNVAGEVVGIDSGPVITLYQVRLAPGTKVNSITSISSDLARSLKASNIRIVPNTEGLDTVGIEVPNRKKEKVRLKELMTSSAKISKMKLPMFLGKDASGNPLIIDLAELPHMLIAGTTGSGKSVCMNAILMGFLYTQKPSDMKLVLVDPKMVELSQFRDIPHLMCPVVTEMGKAAAILEWAVTKMDERYELLAEAGVRDIAAYNGLGWEELKERFNPQTELEEARIPRKLPYMVFVIDELADMMMTNKEVESSIVRIAQKARAVGIHLILATQRPQANVVTGLIKSNMPGRVSFKVASGMDSRIVLDQKGGEVLLGMGDMLMITPRSSVAVRAQGTLVDDIEIRRVVRFVRDVSAPSFERSLIQLNDSGFTATMTAEEHEEKMRQSAEEDPLFDRAVEIVLETKRGSVSLLQRRLAIGYTRASRLIELMGIAGIIGQHKGTVAREVAMSVEEWKAIKDLAAKEAGESDDSLFVDRKPRVESGAAAPALPAARQLAPWEDAPTTSPSPASPADDLDDVPAINATASSAAAYHSATFDDEIEVEDEIEDDAELLDEEVSDEDEEDGEGDAEDAVDDEDEEDEYEVEDSDEEEDEDADAEDEHEEVDDADEDDEESEAEDSEEEDEEELEYEYVDEDGNPIPADQLDQYDFGDESEEEEEEEEEEVV